MRPDIRLYALPYAGGSKVLYYQMARALPASLDFRPLDVPGHGTRMDEKLCDSIREMAEDLLGTVLRDGNDPYALMGYSMGGLIICEFLELARRRNVRMPEFLIIAACNPPHISEQSDPIYELSDEDFLNELAKMGGIEREDVEKLLEYRMFISVLKADFKAVHNYRGGLSSSAADVDALILYSDEEKQYVHDWSTCFSGKLVFRYHEGGHYFIRNDYESLAEELVSYIGEREQPHYEYVTI